MQVLKGAGIDWRERRLINKLCVDESVKVWLVQGEIRTLNTGSWFRQGSFFPPILFNQYSEYFTKEALKGFGEFKTGLVILSVKCANDLALLAKEETVPQGTVDNLTKMEDAVEWK